MKSKPMLSIIIPLYNKEKYIIRCLNSIIEACDNYIEIIVVNDGSTDQSMTILSNYHHKDKITVINKENGGVSSARNAGIHAAQGEWIMFMDADDSFIKGWAYKLEEYIKIYSSCNVLIANYTTIDENGCEIKNMNYKRDRIIFNPLKEIWYRRLYSRPGNTIIKRNIFSIIGYYDESLSYNEDLEFSIRLLSYYKAVVLPLRIMSYFKTNDSASSFIHPIEKDFVCKINNISKGSIWRNLLLYELFLFHKKRCHNSSFVEYHVSTWFVFCYYLNKIYRKIKKGIF